MSTQAAPAKVHTEHAKANDAIEAMREAATTLKELGDDVVELKERNGNLFDEVNRLMEQLAEAEYQAEQGAEALAAVDDYRLGLCDSDELLQRVCGRT